VGLVRFEGVLGLGILSVLLFAAGAVLLFFGLGGVSRKTFLAGISIGMVGLIVVGLTFIYFARHSLDFEPDDTATYVESPGPLPRPLTR
jgi:hypothetical protein